MKEKLNQVIEKKKSHRFVKIGWIFFLLSLITSYFLPSTLRYFDTYSNSSLWIVIVSIPLLLLVATIVISISTLIGAYRSKGIYEAQSMWAIILLIFPLTFLALIIGTPHFHPSSFPQARIKADLQKIEALQEVYYTTHGNYASAIGDLSSAPTPPINGVEYETNETQSCARETVGSLPDGMANPYCITR